MYIYIYNFKFQIWSGYSKFSPIIMDETLSDFCLTVGISFRQTSEQQTPCSSSAATSTENSNSSSPVKTTYCSTSNMTPVRPGPLPANLDDLKVLNALIWRHFTQLYVQYLHRVKLYHCSLYRYRKRSEELGSSLVLSKFSCFFLATGV